MGDIVVHGLDGFSGAIGTAEASGACSPANHVCAPRLGGDADFLSRMLRMLALTGYLSLFGGSARERAVDFRNWSTFSNIPLPTVAVARQQEIGLQIRELRPLRSALEVHGLRVQERRQALITAAIAGQFDVSSAGARSVA